MDMPKILLFFFPLHISSLFISTFPPVNSQLYLFPCKKNAFFLFFSDLYRVNFQAFKVAESSPPCFRISKGADSKAYMASIILLLSFPCSPLAPSLSLNQETQFQLIPKKAFFFLHTMCNIYVYTAHTRQSSGCIMRRWSAKGPHPPSPAMKWTHIPVDARAKGFFH